MLEHARHLPSGGWDARDGHERVPVDLQHFVRAIIDDEISCRRAAVAGDEHAVGEFEREDRGGLRRRGHREPGGCGGDGNLRQQILPAQERGEILGGSGARFREAQRHSVNHWPVRWR